MRVCTRKCQEIEVYGARKPKISDLCSYRLTVVQYKRIKPAARSGEGRKAAAEVVSDSVRQGACLDRSKNMPWNRLIIRM